MRNKHISANQKIFKILLFVIFALVLSVLFFPILNISIKLIQETTSLNYSVTKSNSFEKIGAADKTEKLHELEKFGESFFNSRLFNIAVFTVLQAFVSAFCATLLGIITAYFCAKKEFTGRRFLLSLAAIPFSIPALIMALSYVLFFGKSGILNSTLQIFMPERTGDGNFLYSLFAVVLIHSFYNFPIALKTICNVWENLDVNLENAAVILSNNKIFIFRKVILPELFPAILSSFLLIFIYCFFSFLIILLFGGIGLTTLEVELYQVSRFSLRLIDTAKIAILETGIAIFFVGAYIFSRIKSYKSSVDTRQVNPRTKMNFTERIIFVPVLFLTFLFLVLPLCSILLKSVFAFVVDTKAENFLQRLKSFFKLNLSGWRILFSTQTWIAVLNTVIVGIITASLSVLTAIFIIYFEFIARVKNYKSKFLKALPFFPLVISPVILGFAMRISFKNISNLAFLLLSSAQATTAWTIAYTQINEQFLQIPQNLIQSSLMLSANYFDAFYRGILPLTKKGIKSGFALCFAISAGDTSLPLVLRIHRFKNLSLMIFRLAGAYKFEESAVVAFMLLLLVLFGFLFVEKSK